MTAFRLVRAEEAGPTALGILAPPGRRTVVLLRPRALEWDLVLVQLGRSGPTTTFREFSRDEAEAAVDFLQQSLETAGPDVRVRAAPASDGPGYHVRAEVGRIPLLVCARVPGEPYRPLLVDLLAEAEHVADSLRTVLCPTGNADQELYVNRRNFAS